MDIPGLIAIVLAATQTIKKGIEALLKHEISSTFAWIISFLVVLFAVSFKAVETATPFNFALIVVFLEVLVGGNGTFLFLKKILEALGVLKKPA